jgi:hypothetical protein
MAPIAVNYAEIAFGFLMYNYSIYFPEMLLCFLQLLGIRSFIFQGDKEKYKSIVKKLEKITYHSSYVFRTGKLIPSGYFIGLNCIGYADRESKYIEDERMRIITSTKFYEMLITEDDIEFSKTEAPIKEPSIENKDTENEPLVKKSKKDGQKSKVQVFMRGGSYKSFYYTPITLDVSHITPIGAQVDVLEDILKIYRKKDRVTSFIYGVSLAGKSSIGYLVAKALNGTYCHSFNPTEPGDSFTNLIGEINGRVDDERPFIIVLEEADQIIKAVHDGSIKQHVEVSTQIKCKMSWCGFLDDMIFYKNIVLILTSNESKSNIDKLDPAYLRKGRIDSTYSMMEPLALPVNN